MSENIIKMNFFGLSFSRQIQVLDLYLNDMKMTEYYDDCEKIFEKYMLVVKKFSDFRDSFKVYSDDDRKRMRELIDKCRVKINPNNEIKLNDDCQYCSNCVPDQFVDKYIHDSFSYNKVKRIEIASDFFNYYSDISTYNFDDILGLFNGNREFFNNEIKKISGEFYSLYLLMNTIDRMKYIWYLCHFQKFTSEHVLDNEVDMYGIFNGDCQFIKPLHQGSKENMEKSSVLSKYFKGV